MKRPGRSCTSRTRPARDVRTDEGLGVGCALQDAGYFEGEQQLREKGAVRGMPPMKTALRIGVHIGAGTHR